MNRPTLKRRVLLAAAAGAGTLVILGGNFACANLIIPPCDGNCIPFDPTPDADAAAFSDSVHGDVANDEGATSDRGDDVPPSDRGSTDSDEGKP